MVLCCEEEPRKLRTSSSSATHHAGYPHRQGSIEEKKLGSESELEDNTIDPEASVD